jgi:hypothetical protein
MPVKIFLDKQTQRLPVPRPYLARTSPVPRPYLARTSPVPRPYLAQCFLKVYPSANSRPGSNKKGTFC